jgi:hypothetical protein
MLRVGASGFAPGAAEHRGAAEHAGIEKLEQAPQLAQVIFHRRAAQGQAMIGFEQRTALAESVLAFFTACASSRIAVVESGYFSNARHRG